MPTLGMQAGLDISELFCHSHGEVKPTLTKASVYEIMSNQSSILLAKSKFATLILLAFLLWPFFPARATEKEAIIATGSEGAMALTINDCPKCHSQVAAVLDANGGAHKSKLTCITCHEGHPPAIGGIIPSCGKCHRDRPHFELPGCLGCHTNPHNPLNITLDHQTTGPCTTCHTRQITELREHPSIHASLACTACHSRHGFIPECFRCHAPHLKTMKIGDCLACHPAHMPLEINYPTETPSEYCGVCHPQVYAVLAASHAKHRQLLCAACHGPRHKTIPACQKCHSEPHPQAIMAKFPSCRGCHGLAHELKLNRIDVLLENKR